MKSLLLVTDHIFIIKGDDIYDNYGFDDKFFYDYFQVFDLIYLAARFSERILLKDSIKIDSKRIRIVDLGIDLGINRLINERKARDLIQRFIPKVDGVIIRIPSTFGLIAAQVCHKQEFNYLFEFIGDPAEMFHYASNWPRKFLLILYSKILKKKYFSTVRNSIGGSFVSSYLLKKYGDPNNDEKFSKISSIRIDRNELTNPKQQFSSNLKLITIGSLNALKGHSNLIMALSKLINSGISCDLTIIGEGPERNNLELLIETERIDSNVKMLGHIADKSVINKHLLESDLFILASLSEGLPRVILEAMSKGLPCIGSKVGGIPELLKLDQMFETNDVDSIVKKIRELHFDRNKLKLFASRSSVEIELYTSDILLFSRINMYRKLIDNDKNNLL